MAKVFSFQEQLKEGKIGSIIFQLHALLQPTVQMVRSVEDDEEFQPRGIDFRILRKGNKWTDWECKTDSYVNRNIYFEVWSDVDRSVKGCFLTSEADFWFYYFSSVDIAYILPLRKVREWFLERQSDFRTVNVKNKGWTSVGALVPINEMLADLECVTVVEDVWLDIKLALDEKWGHV